jgi:hypothetical protein
VALTNAAPPGSDVTDALLNALAALGARYEQRAAQSVANATDVKMNFPTAVHTNTDVVASGASNTDFALQRTGFWLVTASVRYLGNAGGGERHIFPQTGSAFAVANRIGQHAAVNVGAAPCAVACSTLIKVTSAPLTIIVGLFQNCGVALNTDNGFGGTNHLSLTWLGPI